LQPRATKQNILRKKKRDKRERETKNRWSSYKHQNQSPLLVEIVVRTMFLRCIQEIERERERERERDSVVAFDVFVVPLSLSFLILFLFFVEL
jgi:hypothetical protein